MSNPFALRAFSHLWLDLFGSTDQCHAVFRDLEQRYSGPRRHYHTLDHVGWALLRAEEILGRSDVRYDIKWAIWFHDAVLTGSDDDELKSAELASRITLEAGGGRSFAETVARLILATSHEPAGLAADEKVIVDADLAILGAAPEVFDE